MKIEFGKKMIFEKQDDFEYVKKIKDKIHDLQQDLDKVISQQREFQEWLKIAIHHNEGVFEFQGNKLIFASNSLNFLRFDNEVRIAIVEMTQMKAFDVVVIFLILIDFTSQSLYDHTGRSTGEMNSILDTIMTVISFCFVIEALLKILAQGLIKHRNAYLKDGWNILDISVCIVSIVEFIFSLMEDAEYIPSFKTLRVLRVLRPLRTIKRVPSMRKLVMIMFKSLPMLGNAILLLCFFFINFGIVGIQTNSGISNQRCRTTQQPVNDTYWPIDPSQNFICVNETLNSRKTTTFVMIYKNICSNGTFCATPVEWGIDPKITDKVWEDEIIAYNTSSFNNIMEAFVTILQALTLEGWGKFMFNMMDTGSPWFALFFYYLIMLLGSFFILNLILAVILSNFVLFQNQQHKDHIISILQTGLIGKDKKGLQNLQKFIKINPKPNILNQIGTINTEENLQTDHSLIPSTKLDLFSRSQRSKETPTLQTKVQTFLKNKASPKNASALKMTVLSAQMVALCFTTNPMPLNLVRLNKILNVASTVAMALELLLMKLQKVQIDQGFLQLLLLSVIDIILESFVLKSGKELHEIATQDEQQFHSIKFKVVQHSIMFLKGCRIFKFVQVFRLFKSFDVLYRKRQKSAKELYSFFVLMLIFVMMYGMLGVELFANKIAISSDDEDVQEIKPRLNFDNIGNSALCVFICLIGDSWNEIMRDVMRSQKSFNSFFYFLPLILIGQMFLMNIFLAIHIKYFQQQAEFNEGEMTETNEQKYVVEKPEINDQADEKKITKMLQKQSKRRVNDIELSNSSEFSSYESTQSREDKKSKSSQHPKNNLKLSFKSLLSGELFKKTLKRLPSMNNSLKIRKQSPIIQKFMKRKSVNQTNQQSQSVRSSQKMSSKSRKLSIRLIQGYNPMELEGTSFYIFSEENPVRKVLSIILFKYGLFDIFILLVILIQAIVVVYENPIMYHDESQIKLVDTASKVVFVIFVAEALIKSIVHGFYFNGSHSYLKNGWNIFDFTIVIISIFTMLYNFIQNQKQNGNHSKYLGFFQILRVLRSFRLMSKIEGVKHCVMGLIYSFPGIMNITIVVSLQFLLMSLFFIQVFSGKFYKCKLPYDDIDESFLNNPINTKWDCINFGGNWIQKDLNFDDVHNAMFSQLVMVTKEGWIEIMMSSADSTDVNMMPVENYNKAYLVFYILFVLFSTTFIINLFTEVIIATYEKQRHIIDKFKSLIAFQHEWIQIEILILNAEPFVKVRARNVIQKVCLDIIHYPYFETVIMFCIFLNTFMLTLVWVEMDPWILSATNILEYAFLVIFGIECAIKITALRAQYFNDNWNIFDFSIVIAGSLMAVFSDAQIEGFSVIRILRVCRVMRLLKKAKRLNNMFNTFIHTIPTFISVFLLIIILIYIFAVLGNRLFPLVKLSGDLDEVHRNFKGYTSSFITLTIIMTGENWYKLMFDLARKPSDYFQCEPDFDIDQYLTNGKVSQGCGTKISYLYFTIYMIFVSLILINLFVAVLIQGFKDVEKTSQCRINELQIQQFINVWSEMDPDGSGYLHTSELGTLIRNIIIAKCEILPSSSKVMIKDSQKLQQFIRDMDLPLYKKYQYNHFYDILISLSKFHLKYQALNNSRPNSQQLEKDSIFRDFLLQTGKMTMNLDEVLDEIETIQKQNDVYICNKLRKKQDQFRIKVFTDMCVFDDIMHTNSIILTTIKLQKIYRKYRLQGRSKNQQAQEDIVQAQKRSVNEVILVVNSEDSPGEESKSENMESQKLELQLKNFKKIDTLRLQQVIKQGLAQIKKESVQNEESSLNVYTQFERRNNSLQQVNSPRFESDRLDLDEAEAYTGQLQTPVPQQKQVRSRTQLRSPRFNRSHNRKKSLTKRSQRLRTTEPPLSIFTQEQKKREKSISYTISPYRSKKYDYQFTQFHANTKESNMKFAYLKPDKRENLLRINKYKSDHLKRRLRMNQDICDAPLF